MILSSTSRWPCIQNSSRIHPPLPRRARRLVCFYSTDTSSSYKPHAWFIRSQMRSLQCHSVWWIIYITGAPFFAWFGCRAYALCSLPVCVPLPGPHGHVGPTPGCAVQATSMCMGLVLQHNRASRMRKLGPARARGKLGEEIRSLLKLSRLLRQLHVHHARNLLPC